MTLRAGLEDTLFSVEVEASSEPRDADAFACAVILAICTASVTPSVGRRTYGRCLRALAAGATARLGFRHPGDYAASADKLGYLATLPWIGPMTRHAAAWNLGLTGAADEPERRAVA